MSRTTFLLAFLILFVSGAFSKTTQLKKNLDIVGGQQANLNQFPWQVYVTVNSPSGAGACGGFLLTPNHVGTAAHCFSNTSTSVDAQAGTNDVSTQATGQLRSSTAFTIHPNYDSVTTLNDAAIVFFATPFVIDNIATRVIPLASTLPTNGTTVYIAGWGDTTFNGTSSTQLLFVDVPFLDLSMCTPFFGTLTTGTQICAGGNVGKDSCQGDSGGGLFTTTNINSPTDAQVIGITSFGDPNGCGTNFPGVYADVPNFAKAFFDSITGAQAGTSSGAAPAATSSGVAAAATSSGVAAAATSSGAAAAATSSGVVAAATSSGVVAASSSGVVAASSSGAVAASSSGAVAASSSGAVAASSSGAVAASQSSSLAASSGAAVASQSASLGGVTPSGTPSESLDATSGAVAASSGAVATQSGTGSAGVVASSSGTRSKNSTVKTPTGLAALNCRQICAASFRTCKFTVRRIRKCRRDKKDCVAKCGNIRPQGL